MNLIHGVIAQPEFPQVDLTEQNAEMLELMLANEVVVRNDHAVADASEWAFRVGHPAVKKGVQDNMDIAGAQVAAVEHGVMVFEAMTLAVVGQGVSQDMLGVNHAAISVLGGRTGDGRTRTIDTLDRFCETMPRSAEVIRSASHRFFPTMTHYALLGAALEREIALAEATMDFGRS